MEDFGVFLGRKLGPNLGMRLPLPSLLVQSREHGYSCNSRKGYKY